MTFCVRNRPKMTLFADNLPLQWAAYHCYQIIESVSHSRISQICEWIIQNWITWFIKAIRLKRVIHSQITRHVSPMNMWTKESWGWMSGFCVIRVGNDDSFFFLCFFFTIPLNNYHSPVHTHYVLHSNMLFFPIHKLTMPNKYTPCNWSCTTAGYCFHLSTNFQCCQLNEAGKNRGLRGKIEQESEKERER